MTLSDIQTTKKRECLRIHPFNWRIEANLDKSTMQFMLHRWAKKTKAKTQRSFVNYLNLYSHLGISASQPTDELPPGHIRRMEGLSNSKLTRLKRQLLGQADRYPERCLVFGQAFHANALEQVPCDLPEWNLRPSETKALRRMRDAYIIEMGGFLQRERLSIEAIEQAAAWTDAGTGIRCKGQLDLRCPDIDFDLKSTSARSRRHFMQMLSDYDYDRQAAFYLDGSGKQAFGFVAVQKREPFEVFILTLDRDSELIRQGRKKYRFLLRKWQEVNAG